MSSWHRVPVTALARDGRVLVDVDGHQIALFAADGTVHAFENACPHAGNPLIEGEIRGGTLTCVYHLWRFDLGTGECLSGEAPARRYETKVRDGSVWIELT